MHKLKERLLLCRKARNLKQTDVAEGTGIIYRSYCRYERGEAEPSFSTVVKIADYFNVSLDYLAGRTDEP